MFPAASTKVGLSLAAIVRPTDRKDARDAAPITVTKAETPIALMTFMAGPHLLRVCRKLHGVEKGPQWFDASTVVQQTIDAFLGEAIAGPPATPRSLPSRRLSSRCPAVSCGSRSGVHAAPRDDRHRGIDRQRCRQLTPQGAGLGLGPLRSGREQGCAQRQGRRHAFVAVAVADICGVTAGSGITTIGLPSRTLS
jgi:hypothetical protein